MNSKAQKQHSNNIIQSTNVAFLLFHNHAFVCKLNVSLSSLMTKAVYKGIKNNSHIKSSIPAPIFWMK